MGPQPAASLLLSPNDEHCKHTHGMRRDELHVSESKIRHCMDVLRDCFVEPKGEGEDQ